MDKLHQMNKNHLTQSNEERLSTPNHVLSSLSSLDFSKKAGDNFNDLVGTRCWTWRPLVWKRIRHSMLKNLVVQVLKHIHKVRERNRDTQIVLYYSNGNNLTTRLQELVYILTHLGQLPFTLFTQIT